ncbi:alpha-1,3-mannosyl-glycoprotein 2-beta-N-acetylglucosaminyltransferase isoform X2 [Amyelois transitella]|uniref:alpha-1,3-mannosyl-glycoprotein 2-beta-N-acetylglucosaminyltransferase isoform X2 n=1 Tax=Amyelois transitella TaxID=680683 RepID=UPI00298F48A1|nr:alpha-1,3-mannosyl-glycoprotein 2-beta-N-acetylglucosaminyltransferase isoform X2 [Amyelois transitella]
MRVYMKRLILIVIVCGLLWIIMPYSQRIEIPSMSKSSDLQNMEKRIDILKLELSNQMDKSKVLLEKVAELKEALDSKRVNLKGKGDGKTLDTRNLVLPILVIACDRVTVSRCLENLVKYRPDKRMFPIIVSQDCGHNATYRVIKSFTDSDPSITVVRQPDQSAIALPKTKVKFAGYYKIARHFKFALDHVLHTLGHDAVIIVEDDLDISQDFYEYFLGTYPLLLEDDSLWCISAWNDNGKRDVIDLSAPELLHRTDFFPGLGWMIMRHTWTKLAEEWPPAFFDDWLRNPMNTDGKACIRPEISRTHTFGKIGVSKGLFYENHLKSMHLNTKYVEFTKLDLSYLLKKFYDPALEETVSSLPVTTADQLEAMPRGSDAVKLTYSNARSFQHQARVLGLMDDFRSGVPRTAYRGIVTCMYRGRRVYLVPSFPWEKYDPSWG